MQHIDERGLLLAVDLDETLLDVNTFPLLVRALPVALLRAGRFTAVGSLTAALVRRKILGRPHSLLQREVVRLVDLAHAPALDRWARVTWERHHNRRLVEEVAAWEGPIVLTTACAQAIAERFAEFAGISVVHGSRWANGVFTDNSGAQKVLRLREDGFGSPALAVSDDPAADAPLLDDAERAVVLAPGHPLHQVPVR